MNTPARLTYVDLKFKFYTFQCFKIAAKINVNIRLFLTLFSSNRMLFPGNRYKISEKDIRCANFLLDSEKTLCQRKSFKINNLSSEG